MNKCGQQSQPTQPATLQYLTTRAVILLLLASVFLLVACGGTSGTNNGSGNGAVKSITVASKSGSYKTPLDAALDPEGQTIYFTAQGSRGPGVFRVANAGGEATEIASGAPFASPAGIVVSSDGAALYVADTSAASGGAILRLPTSGGTPTIVAGTAGSAPRNLDLIKQGADDLLYFSGVDTKDKQPGVFSIAAVGAAAPAVVAKGQPLAEPDGVAVTKTLTVYVADRAGKILKIADGKVSTALEGVKVGAPAGIALSLDEQLLLISALNMQSGNDEVAVLDLASGKTLTVDKVVSQNRNSSGGVHRALRVDQYAWADRSGGGKGKGNVFSVAVIANCGVAFCDATPTPMR